MKTEIWNACIAHLSQQMSEGDASMLLPPLQVMAAENGTLELLAPNEIVIKMMKPYLPAVKQALATFAPANAEDLTQEWDVQFFVGMLPELAQEVTPAVPTKRKATRPKKPVVELPPEQETRLNTDYTFDNFIEGRANQMALAACSQIASNPGLAYNPLFIYGNTGLGKTHLMQAVGNALKTRYADARICYLHCDEFVGDVVRALRNKTIDDVRQYYRSLNALLIDDIQFLSGKETTQEVFFHTFNTLLEGRQQVILTCDRYPKEMDGLEERLKSRFSSGLIVSVEPPELEHRVAILMSKAEHLQVDLPSDVAFFIAQTVQSNVRELEGALRQVVASCEFRGCAITLSSAQQALAHLLQMQQRLVNVENVQRMVCDYYRVSLEDMLSSNRARTITRPRQMAMLLSRELCNQSLPEIARQFGNRNHTTVLHACNKMLELLDENAELKKDYASLKASFLC